MALTKVLLCLLVISLGFAHLNGVNAIPTTRTKNLMHETLSRFNSRSDSHLDTKERIRKVKLTRRRMTVELEDYPGSGPNNRHTPRAAEFGRGCSDC